MLNHHPYFLNILNIRTKWMRRSVKIASWTNCQCQCDFLFFFLFFCCGFVCDGREETSAIFPRINNLHLRSRAEPPLRSLASAFFLPLDKWKLKNKKTFGHNTRDQSMSIIRQLTRKNRRKVTLYYRKR